MMSRIRWYGGIKTPRTVVDWSATYINAVESRMVSLRTSWESMWNFGATDLRV